MTSFAAAALFMLLMGPNLLIFLWHSEWNPKGIKWTFIRDVLSHLWVGTAFAFHHAPEHYVELGDVARAAPVFFRTALAATGALCLLGAVRLAVRGRAGGMLLAVVLLPAPLLIWSVDLRQSMIYERHVIFALPSFAILLGAGLEGLFAWLRSPRATAAATVAVMLAYLGGYLWLSRDVRSTLRSVPIQPNREAVLMMRPSLDPFAEENLDILTVGWQSALILLRPQHPRDLRARAASRSSRRGGPHRPRALRQLRASLARPQGVLGAAGDGGARGSLRAGGHVLRLRAARHACTCTATGDAEGVSPTSGLRGGDGDRGGQHVVFGEQGEQGVGDDAQALGIQVTLVQEYLGPHTGLVERIAYREHRHLQLLGHLGRGQEPVIETGRALALGVRRGDA